MQELALKSDSHQAIERAEVVFVDSREALDVAYARGLNPAAEIRSIAPALLTGFAMAFARAIGEYGSVIFIAGSMPMISEITPLIIIGKLEQYDYAGATAVALVMLVISFLLLLVINGLQAWQRRRAGA